MSSSGSLLVDIMKSYLKLNMLVTYHTPANDDQQIPYNDSDQQVPVQGDPRYPQTFVEKEHEDRGQTRCDGESEHSYVEAIPPE